MDRDPSKAVAPLQQAIQEQAEMLDPSSPSVIRAHSLLGIAYLDLGDRVTAREQMAKVNAMLQKHPKLSDPYLRAACILAARLAGSQRAATAATRN